MARRPIPANLAILAAALLLAYLAADRAAAWLLSRPPDCYPSTRFSSGDIVKDSIGHRDYEYAEAKAPGVYRVIAIGDSFTWGGGVNFDDIWPKRLERYLRDYENVKGVSYEVLNWALPGTATPSQVRNLRRAASRYRPDLVVLGYCLNDAEHEADKKAVTALRNKLMPPLKPGHGLKRFLFNNSALFRLLATRFAATRNNRGQVTYYQELYRDAYPGWEATRAALADLGTWRSESGVPVVVMVFPLYSWSFDDRYPFADIHGKLHGELERAGLPYLDLLEANRGLDHTALEAYPYKDPHPSDIAHRIAAEQLYGYLGDAGLLPDGEPIAAKLDERRIPQPWR